MSSRVIHQTTRKLISAVDRAVLTRLLTPPPAALDPIEALTHAERMDALHAMAAFYDRPEHLESNSGFFSRLPRIGPSERTVRRYGKAGDVVDLSWPSQFEALWTQQSSEAHFQGLLDALKADSQLAEHAQLARSVRTLRGSEQRLRIEASYSAAEPANLTMRARWFRHREGPRACAVILHGYLGGRLAIEEHMWPVRSLFERGMDVVLTVLPMHGVRARATWPLRLPGFPSSDPRLAIEGFRHLVHDHLSLLDYLLDGRVSALGLMGMSLGGYASALLCTLDPRIRFCVLYMPLASIADFALRTGRMVGSLAEQHEQAAGLERVYTPVSPLARPSLLPAGHTLVLSGEADLITGIPHGQRLATHFDAVSRTYSGGHILPLGKDAAFAPLWKLLHAADLLSTAPN